MRALPSFASLTMSGMFGSPLAPGFSTCQSVPRYAPAGPMHGFANPARFLRIARWLTPALLLAGLVRTAGALAWGWTGLRAERLRGETGRIVLVRVRSAWLGVGGGAAIAIASRVGLVWRHPLAAVAARAAAAPGAAFAAMCLATGSIWGRP